ncbi:alpha/beta fold hydrolase [Halorubellus sp. JP-L1]|uniref:alpha/beta hydrolase n=1 Tax=Halorubellus sp. JP-L1 TaxID=2715753 RepID=UPI001409CB74|nr:dienelactone hydrolase family protein [Halorubellus sp. JP-L1]NHN41967.1 alpha/beta fold hydrolase [Halorubellus sp. JP-L1]
MSARNPHSGDDPHGDQPVSEAGADLADASAAVVCVHGRGATAQSMLQITGQFGFDDVAYLAPQAAGRTWYPNPFTAPTESNQPGLRSGLATVGALVDRAADAVGREHVVVLGFSQGACLGSEYVARNPARYGGLVVFSGGLIGPEVSPDQYDGDLDGTPAFLGCDDNDPHIALERVHESTAVLEHLGADVDERIYQGIGHGVVEDELDAAISIVDDARDDAA